MTKKDYIIIAEAIKPTLMENGLMDFDAFLHNFCLSAKADNPKFNAEKFKQFILK